MQNNKFVLFLIVFGYLYGIIGYSYFGNCTKCFYEINHILDACTVKIDINALVVLIGFYGAILAFFIPHSIDMISKIGDQYESEIIADRFRQEKFIQILPFNLIIGIFTSFFIILFFNIDSFGITTQNLTTNGLSIFKNFLIFLLSCHFIFVVFLIYNYINRLKFYTNVDEVLAVFQAEITNAIE